MLDVIVEMITNEKFVGAILISLSFILLGFILRRKNIIPTDGKKVLTFLVLKIALPAMAFSAFMTEISSEHFLEDVLVFIVSLVLYIVVLSLGKLCFIKMEKSKRCVIAIFMAIGQLTFFSIPVLKTIYVDSYSEIMIPANMMTLAFRFVLYIYCYFTISKLEFTKEKIVPTLKKLFFQPIMIAMVCGGLVWLTQGILPQVTIGEKSYSFLRIDKTLPGFYMVISSAEKMTTPLAMLVVGCILGETDMKEALKDRLSWLIAIIKTLIVPIFALIFLILLQGMGLIHFNEQMVMVIVIGFGAPLSAVVSAYCSEFHNEMELASRVCFLSTMLSILTFPLLFIIVQIILRLPMFVTI